MKAMNTGVNHKGDDDYFYRLLSYFQSKFYEKIIKMVPIRKNVIFIQTEKNIYMLKGYSTNNRLKLQETFTATLRKEGFTKASVFIRVPAKGPLFFEGMYFGCMEYIKPSQTPFSFRTQKNRLEGLELLRHYHQVTASVEVRYRTLLQKSFIFEKWQERADVFSKNIPFFKHFVNEALILEMLEWANWSLNGMDKRRSFFLNDPFVILHGDLAHHNFLRSSAESLYLIDFDLISIGPESLDYLQYANRMLPSLDWSVKRLGEFPTLSKFLNEKAFLYALAFPADIFREWNRLIREESFTNQFRFKQVMDLTLGKYFLRKQFIEHLKELVH